MQSKKLKSILSIAIAAILLSGIVSIVQPTTIRAQEPEVTTSSQGTLQVSAEDIQRGNTQTIHIQSDSPGSVIGILTYPSGHQVFMQGETDEQGALDYSFKIGGNTKPGTFNVDVLAATDAGKASGSTTFQVTPKGALVPPGEIPEVPVEENTTTAPEEPVVVAPENETTVVTPDNSTDIVPPVNDTSVIIPSNETTIPDPVQNDTEVIIAPENETEIVTEENASSVPEIPDEVVEDINETSVIVPGNVTEIGENATVSEPLPEDVQPISNDTTAGNVTDIVVVPPGNVTGLPEGELPPQVENITEEIPPAIDANVTAPTEENVTVVENASETVPTPEPAPIEENVTAPPPFLPENETAEPVPFPPQNETETPPATNVTVDAPANGNVTVETPESNVTVTEPSEIPTTPNGTTPTEPEAEVPTNVTVTEPAEPPFAGTNVTETEAPIGENVTVEAPTEGNVTVETPESNVTVTEEYQYQRLLTKQLK